MKIKLVKPTLQAAATVQLHAESKKSFQGVVDKRNLESLHRSELSK